MGGSLEAFKQFLAEEKPERRAASKKVLDEWDQTQAEKADTATRQLSQQEAPIIILEVKTGDEKQKA